MLNDSIFALTPVVPRSRKALGRNLLLAAVIAGVTGCASLQPSNTPASSFITQQQPSLSIKKDIDLVRLEGILASDEEIESVYERASALYGQGMIINDLKRSDSVTPAGWLGGVLEMADAIAMADVDDFSLTANDGQLTIGGEVESESTAMAIEEMANRMTEQQLVVSNRLLLSDAAINLAERSVEQPQTDTADELVLAAASTPTTKEVSPIILEQQAMMDTSNVEPVVPALALASPQVLVSDAQIEPQFGAAIAHNRVELPPAADYDRDGVANTVDECDSRVGYPVNNLGCELLNGNLKNVRFQGKTDQLTDRAMSSLDSLASIMLNHPDSKIAVLSYSSDSGNALDMRGQARERVRSVVTYLVERGVTKNRLQAYAFGHKNGSKDQIMIQEID